MLRSLFDFPSIPGLDVNRVDLKGGSSGGSSHDGSSSSHHSTSDLISQFVDGQYLTTEVGSHHHGWTISHHRGR